MKKRKVYFLILILAAVCMAGMPSFARAEKKKPRIVQKSITMIVGDSDTIKVQNKPSNSPVKWTSSNGKIASVSKKGRVKAVKVGSLTVNCKIGAGKDAINLKVKIKVEAPQWKKKKALVTKGKTIRLLLKQKPDSASYKWRSANPKIASVNQTGVVKGIKKGKAEILCEVKTGGEIYVLKQTVAVTDRKKAIATPKPAAKPAPTPENQKKKGEEEEKRPEGGQSSGGGQNSENKPEPTKKPEPAKSIQYRYDALDRLTMVMYPDGSRMEYQYDKAGNITEILKHK